MNNMNKEDTQKASIDLALWMGDNALILGHRLAELCGHGPILEQDIALTNIALDLVGQARMWLTLAGDLEGKGRTEDDFAYLRSDKEFTNIKLVELPNQDWGYVIARQFIFDAHHLVILEQLCTSSEKAIADIAQKAIKEVQYHLRFSSEWIIRLGDGTEFSRKRMQSAFDKLAPYIKALTLDDPLTILAKEAGIGIDNKDVEEKAWKTFDAILSEATLELESPEYFHKGGKQGLHTEHMGFIIAEMQSVVRAMPNNKW
ncbi:MAG: phenylacetate-CoA oxygenase subunit PaaC [Saprospiraceae bacterium]|nr:phenylacetate-CoA oxygenase subunit PaaC [Saprospiraceae bacterium]